MASGIRFISANIAVVVLALLACKGASVEGKYSLDKADTKAQMQAEIQKMPEGEREMAQLGIAFVDLLEMTIELKAGGTSVVETKVPNIETGQSDVETEQGTWTHNDGTVTIVSGGDTLSCPVADGKLRCKDKKGKTIVFLKS